MPKNTRLKPLFTPVGAAVGAAFIASVAGGQALAAPAAADNPFAMTELAGGYRVADAKGAEGQCGASKKAAADQAAMATQDKKKADDAASQEGDQHSGAQKMSSKPAKTAEGQCGGAKK